MGKLEPWALGVLLQTVSAKAHLRIEPPNIMQIALPQQSYIHNKDKSAFAWATWRAAWTN